MNLLAPLALAFLAALVLSAGMIAILLPWLRRRALDRPNHRSMHEVPTPTGGGLGIILAITITMAALQLFTGLAPSGWILLGPMAALAILSFADDLINLPILFRLSVHAGTVWLGLHFLPPDALVFQGALPHWADRLLAGAAWLIFLNFMNFMDGIDAIVGAELTILGLGVILTLTFAGGSQDQVPELLAVVMAGAALGFLLWNRPPARIFMGDAGSVPLGFLSGGLLLWLAARGLWAPALLLPLYVLADAGLTLAGRIWRRERFWHAHRNHFYQRAAARIGHGGVVGRVLILNVCLLVAALVSVNAPPLIQGLALAAATVCCGMTLILLNRTAAGDARPKN